MLVREIGLDPDYSSYVLALLMRQSFRKSIAVDEEHVVQWTRVLSILRGHRRLPPALKLPSFHEVVERQQMSRRKGNLELSRCRG